MRVCAVLVCLTALLAAPARAQTYPTDPDHLTSRAQEENLGGAGLGIGDGRAGRVLAALALDLIKDYERWRPNAYNDASNYCTIGYGHLIAKKSCANCQAELSVFTQPLPLDAGLRLLDGDTLIARAAVSSLVREPLDDGQFGAVTSLVFNIGVGNFSKSTMLKFLNNGEYDGAAAEFPKWVRSGGKVLNGLIGRRSCEAMLFAGKLTAGRDGKFRRSDCESLGAAPDSDRLYDVVTGE